MISILIAILFSFENLTLFHQLEQQLKKSPLRNHPRTPYFKPGYNRLPGIEFKLNRTLFNATSNFIRSAIFDSTNQILSVEFFHYENLIGSIFVEGETQKGYLLEQLLYKTPSTHFFKVLFLDLILKVFPDISLPAPSGVNCKSGKCTITWPLYWDTSKPDPWKSMPIERKIDKVDGITFFAGGYIEASASLGLKISGLLSASMSYDFNIRSIFGLGFSSKEISKKDIILFTGSKTILGYTVSIAGYKFGISLDLVIELRINEIALIFPNKLYFYREIPISFNKGGQIGSSNANAKPNFQCQIPKSSQVTFEDVFDFMSGIKLNIRPAIRVYGQLSINIPTIDSIELKVGLEYQHDLTFGANRDNCPCTLR